MFLGKGIAMAETQTSLRALWRNTRRIDSWNKVQGVWWLMACLGLAVGNALHGQPIVPQAPPRFPMGHAEMTSPPRTFLSKNKFFLPVKIDPNGRASLQEVRLYLKDHPEKPWVLSQKDTAKITYFAFQAPRDGEYWFRVVTVDKKGRTSAPDIQREAPQVIVVVDTQPPVPEVQATSHTPDGLRVKCIVRDANLDVSKTRFSYQTGDGRWYDVNPVPDDLTCFCIPKQAVLTGKVRIIAMDLAKNKAEAEYDVGSTVPDARTAEATTQKSVQVQSASFTSRETKQPPLAAAEPQAQPSAPKRFSFGSLPRRYLDDSATGAKQEESTGPMLTDLSNQPGDLQPNKIKHSVQRSPAAKVESQLQPRRRLVNKTRLFLDYQIENIGASGIGRVEVWMTRDQGQSWQKLCMDPDRKSPVEVKLPGEGLFGLSLVLSNGRGFGATPPSPGDTPDWWIEVDATRPVAEITGIRAGTGADDGCLLISWKAEDRNLAEDPIELYYAIAREGPWQCIAKGLKNDGRFRWAIPNDLGPEAFIRVVARDAAGNIGYTQTPRPVTLDDLSRPRARVIGVNEHGSN
jgi:hypothetical protein